MKMVNPKRCKTIKKGNVQNIAVVYGEIGDYSKLLSMPRHLSARS